MVDLYKGVVGGIEGGYHLIVFVVFFLCFCILLSHIIRPFIYVAKI